LAPIKSDLTASVAGDYIFEPSKKRLFWLWFQNHWKHNCTKWIRDSLLPEHGARMTAMHKATDNATELRINWNWLTIKHVKLLLLMRS
jgi:F-type H+-transporting ATPase subunit gamma